MTGAERVAEWRRRNPEEAKRQTRDAMARHRERLRERKLAIASVVTATTQGEAV